MTMSNLASPAGDSPHPWTQDAHGLLEFVDRAGQSQTWADLAESVLPAVADLTCSGTAILYVADARLLAPLFLAHGLPTQATAALERRCAKQFETVAAGPGAAPVTLDVSPAPGTALRLVLWPLTSGRHCCGFLGLDLPQETVSAAAPVLERLVRLLTCTVDRLVERTMFERQIAHLNTYLTISSMLAQSLDLHELLEGVLYCCMDAVSAEAASVLLLDDDMQRFRFYHVAGPAQMDLSGATLPVNEGIAGFVFQNQEPALVNDARNDLRFCGQFDADSGFQTRSLIAVPLSISQEKIGMLEVLNKVDDGSFTTDEQMLLLSIAEEIALAIRNAKVFEYVVSSYCKRRQGETSCRGCRRPLGAWTPCVQYRKTSVTGLWQISDATAPKA
ncbi:MAG: GAF domain-containing protein [Chloroflexi bacterium]|nr:GAF domain-containing protein [Chloroflexota bacterium]